MKTETEKADSGRSSQASGSPAEYRIRVFADILKIPRDRIGAFLSELPAGIEATRCMVELGCELDDDFVWIDDGAPSVMMHIGESEDAKLTERPEGGSRHE